MKWNLLKFATFIIFATCSFHFPCFASTEIIGYEKIISTDLLSHENAEIIVTLSASSSKTRGNSKDISFMSSIELQKQVISKLSEGNGKVDVQLQSLPIFSANVTQQGIKELAAMPEVYSIEKNWPVQTYTRQGIPLMKGSATRNTNGGKGVSIAIVDTGMNYNHPALGGPGFPNSKVIGGYDFGDNDPDPQEGSSPNPYSGENAPNSHGTSCAGIAAGLDTGKEENYIGGVAPEAKLYALKVWDKHGNASMMAILNAWDWAISHQYDDPDNPIMIISNSLGIPNFQASNFCDNRFPALTRAAKALETNGIALFIASGNEGQMNSIAAPACLNKAISVGAVYDESNDSFAADDVPNYSNSSEILDILAPSENASTPSSPGNIYSDDFNGTSAATPYAAGAAALIQSHIRKKTGEFLFVQELKLLMKENGDLVMDNKSGLQTPRVNVAEVIAELTPSSESVAKEVSKKTENPSTKTTISSEPFVHGETKSTQDNGATIILDY